MPEAPYPGVRIRNSQNVALVQPLRDSEENVPTLRVDLKTGKVDLSRQAALKRDCLVSPGLIGVMKLKGMAVLAIVKATNHMGTVVGHPAFHIVETDFILPEHGSAFPEDAQYLSLLKSALNPEQHGRGLYFSYTGHLTLSTERNSDLQADLQSNTASQEKQWWELEDPRFFFNRFLSTPISACGAHGFVLPVMQGFVGELNGLVFSEATQWGVASLTLIARRSVQRLGTRHWRRGVDKEGFAANFVESEQIVTFDNGKHVASFVTVRGSVPTFWTQIPCIKYKPPTKISPSEVFSPAFDRHITQIVSTYKEVVGISLVNQHGSEGMLSRSFVQESRKFQDRGFKLVPFDFHKECGAKNYHRISVLWNKIEADFKAFGYFKMENGQVTMRQSGVFRTNCVDCLDRTNVLQGVLGRRALEAFLRDVGLLNATDALANAFPAVEERFKILWADHGDECSLQYAGTGALKSGFTRTGKRTIGGLIDDGVKSTVRYYLNNFQDGRKQDALDLVTGGHKLGENWSPFQNQPSPTVPIALAVILFLTGLIQFTKGLFGSEGAIKLSVLAFALSYGIVYVLMKLGPKLVNKPQLRPELTKQW
ncbi:hypothetical protein BSKO_05831 [Bryopsis sp. KO-2023]|nr:hypothetical protein BSKO_05831 [Bryopsis sp. KO-2023]